VAKARKKRGAKKSTSASSRKRNAKRASRVAERARPGWVAVPSEIAQDAAPAAAAADSSVPELGQLQKKYFGSSKDLNNPHPPSDDAHIVAMQPKSPASDIRGGRKATVVEKGKVIGQQG
jgi:hypothetical protein